MVMPDKIYPRSNFEILINGVYLVGNSTPRLSLHLLLLLVLQSSLSVMHRIPVKCKQILKIHLHHQILSVSHCNNRTSAIFGNFRQDRMLIIIVCTNSTSLPKLCCAVFKVTYNRDQNNKSQLFFFLVYSIFVLKALLLHFLANH